MEMIILRPKAINFKEEEEEIIKIREEIRLEYLKVLLILI
jgi:hypothetical protein